MTDALASNSLTAVVGDPRSIPARLPFAWWNTKLGALKGKTDAKRESHVDAVRAVVQMLIEQEGCVLLGLAEVRGQDVLQWVPAHVRADWDVIEDRSSDRHPFGVAMIFDRTRLSSSKVEWARGHHATHRVRAGLVTTFEFVDNSDHLIVAAAHWRSGGDAGDHRVQAAGLLKAAIVAHLSDVGESVPVLIVGDFNAEPYEVPFGGILATARSRAEVQRHSPGDPSDLLFYNAAWRWLGERYPYGGDPATPTLAGTYRWAGKNVPKTWRTFDQVLVSPSLLGGLSWSLDERMLDIFHDPCVFEAGRSRPQAPFDHLPIVGHLQRPALSSTHRVRQS